MWTLRDWRSSDGGEETLTELTECMRGAQSSLYAYASILCDLLVRFVARYHDCVHPFCSLESSSLYLFGIRHSAFSRRVTDAYVCNVCSDTQPIHQCIW